MMWTINGHDNNKTLADFRRDEWPLLA